MSNIYCIFIGWEERCLISALDSLDKSYDLCLIMYSTEFIHRTESNRQSIINRCNDLNIPYKCEEVPVFDPAKSWTACHNLFNKIFDSNVLINISTMPRSIMWISFGLLEHNNCNISFIYARPASYGDNITGSPLSPWIQPKQSGIPDLDKPVALLISVGFDTDRTQQLIKYFSPEIIVMAGQAGTDYQTNERCTSEHIDKIVSKQQPCSFGGCTQQDCKASFVSIDSYSGDFGYSTIKPIAQDLLSNYNLVLSSLGPKPSAVAIYKIYKDFPVSALVYAPYKEISTNYSSGVKEYISGAV